MQRVRLANLQLGDPDDVAIYAGAAIWNWMQTPDFKVFNSFDIAEDKMYWTQGKMLPHSVTIDVWVDVEKETEILLKLSGLCQL